MKDLERLEKAIGPRPVVKTAEHAPYYALVRWFERALEHETARAERWKAEAIEMDSQDENYFLRNPERVESIDKGET